VLGGCKKMSAAADIYFLIKSVTYSLISRRGRSIGDSLQTIQPELTGKVLAVLVETRTTRMSRSFSMTVAWWKKEAVAQRQD